MVINYRAVSRAYQQGLETAAASQEWAWLHCLNYFSKARTQVLSVSDLNMLCLHLTLYLAESNLYRGCSFILQHGYKVHREGVALLLAPRYQPLSQITVSELAQEGNLSLLMELIAQLEAIYGRIRQQTYARQGKAQPQSPVSQQLISTILLGTLACLPRYDTRSQQAYRRLSISPRSFSREGLAAALAFYQGEQPAFEALAQTLTLEGHALSELKLLDIVLQQEGRLTSN